MRDQRGPARLMRGTEPRAGVAVEVLVERDVVAPPGIGGEVVGTVDRPPSVRSWHGRVETSRRTRSSAATSSVIRLPGPGRVLDREPSSARTARSRRNAGRAGAVEREPDRASPVASCRRTAPWSTRPARSRPRRMDAARLDDDGCSRASPRGTGSRRRTGDSPSSSIETEHRTSRSGVTTDSSDGCRRSSVRWSTAAASLGDGARRNQLRRVRGSRAARRARLMLELARPAVDAG